MAYHDFGVARLCVKPLPIIPKCGLTGRLRNGGIRILDVSLFREHPKLGDVQENVE